MQSCRHSKGLAFLLVMGLLGASAFSCVAQAKGRIIKVSATDGDEFDELEEGSVPKRNYSSCGNPRAHYFRHQELDLYSPFEVGVGVGSSHFMGGIVGDVVPADTGTGVIRLKYYTCHRQFVALGYQGENRSSSSSNDVHATLEGQEYKLGFGQMLWFLERDTTSYSLSLTGGGLLHQYAFSLSDRFVSVAAKGKSPGVFVDALLEGATGRLIFGLRYGVKGMQFDLRDAGGEKSIEKSQEWAVEVSVGI